MIGTSTKTITMLSTLTATISDDDSEVGEGAKSGTPTLSDAT